jgi:murein DD-endopeptidase / murein LD-carboxypeptidase
MNIYINRKFFYLLFILIISIFSFSSINTAKEYNKPDILSKQNDILKDIMEDLKNITNTYNIEIHIDNIFYTEYAAKWAVWDNIGKEDYKELFPYLRLFINEWNKYPVDWSDKSGIKAIAFVKELNEIGQYKPYFIDQEGKTIYYDIGYDYTGEAFQQYIIHKAFIKLMLNNNSIKAKQINKKWIDFNIEDFEYNKPLSSTFYNEYEFFYQKHTIEGFVNDYATYSVLEDKASTYAFLMTGKLYLKLMTWIETDTILSQKTNFLKVLMATNSDAINEDYFYKLSLLYKENNPTELYQHLPIIENDVQEDKPLSIIEIPEDYNDNKSDQADVLIIPPMGEEYNSKAQDDSAFNKLLSMINDEVLKQELREYRKEGMEKELDTKGVSSDKVINTAKEYMGTPHKFGGNDKKGIDCSGLIVKAFSKHGIQLPRTANEQARYGWLIPEKTNLKRGDLVFFHNTYETERLITHVAIYMGNNEILHSSSSQGVSIASLDNSYWKKKYIFSTRVFD